VSEKLPLLIGDGAAFTVAPEAIVIGSMPGVEVVRSEPLTLAPLNPTVPKSASGRTPLLLDGASAITSADPSFADLSRFEVVCDPRRACGHESRDRRNDTAPQVAID
jgi:hypothetical protein